LRALQGGIKGQIKNNLCSQFATFRVPEDLSVISYDNIEFARFAKVPLTSINYSKEALGRGAVELVLEQIDNAERARPK
jgi:DNA-binding LacI/PurR family transcriptional regulator